MKKLLAFTLSELLISLAVLGLICAIILPAAMSNAPNQNKMMVKKSYYTFGEIISNLINNATLYPVIEGYCFDKREYGYAGFDCYDTTAKLPYYFAKNLNNRIDLPLEMDDFTGSVSEYKSSGLEKCIVTSGNCYRITTPDKTVWTFPESSSNYFEKGNANSYIYVGADVNGDKGPNCFQGENSSCSHRDKNFDQFIIRLFADGGVEIKSDQIWAKDAITVGSSISGKE